MVHKTAKPNINPIHAAYDAVENGAMQNPIELAVLVDFLHSRIRPKTIVEIGCARGHTMRLWESLPTVEKVVGISLDSDEYGVCNLPNVLKVDSVSETAYSTMVDLTPDFIHVDGGHDYKTAKQDIENAIVATRTGGLIAVHDIWTHTRIPEFGVSRAWHEIRKEYPHWMMWEIVVDPYKTPGFGLILKEEFRHGNCDGCS